MVFADNTQLRPAYEQGQCDGWTSDASQIGSFKVTIGSEGGADQFIMSELSAGVDRMPDLDLSVVDSQSAVPSENEGDFEWVA